MGELGRLGKHLDNLSLGLLGFKLEVSDGDHVLILNIRRLGLLSLHLSLCFDNFRMRLRRLGSEARIDLGDTLNLVGLKETAHHSLLIVTSPTNPGGGLE